MTWSTKQLADLAAVSLKTVRHYHDVGLLPEPERLPNGYKQYDISHLVTVLRIKRMSSLGLSLDQVAELLEDPQSGSEQLSALHSELTDTITRLELVRADIETMLESGAAPDLAPRTLAAMNALGMDDRGRNAAIVVSDLDLPAHFTRIFAELTRSPDEFTDLNEAFAQLSADAGADEQRELAGLMTAAIGHFLSARPELLTPAVAGPNDDIKTEAVLDAMQTKLNPAQEQTLDHVTQELKRHAVSAPTVKRSD